MSASEGAARACIGIHDLGVRSYTPLHRERALIVYDARSQRQQLVLGLTFEVQKAKQGFIIPCPSRPLVGKVKAPWEKLSQEFPTGLRLPFLGGPGIGGLSGAGAGAGGAGARPPVQVVNVNQVGSFRATTLAASQPKALTAWLKQRGFEQVPEKALASYVKLGFYYLAMEYKPPPKRPGAVDPLAGLVGSGGVLGMAPLVEAETIRISFSTPNPFFPYSEPSGSLTPGRGQRAFEAWVVSTAPFRPLAALRPSSSKSGVVVPWARSRNEKVPFKRLLGVLSGAAQLPAAKELQLRAYTDTRGSRSNFGDVVFAPEAPLPARDPKLRERLTRILVPEVGS